MLKIKYKAFQKYVRLNCLSNDARNNTSLVSLRWCLMTNNEWQFTRHSVNQKERIIALIHVIYVPSMCTCILGSSQRCSTHIARNGCGTRVASRFLRNCRCNLEIRAISGYYAHRNYSIWTGNLSLEIPILRKHFHTQNISICKIIIINCFHLIIAIVWYFSTIIQETRRIKIHKCIFFIDIAQKHEFILC